MTQKNTLSPMERLNQLQGLDNIREQFEKYRAAYKRYVEGKVGGRFHPHMAFMGNPGTGKNTVARLFGEILHEDGLLPQGQFVEATVGDLVGQYIGETRVKAGALCDQARGGVLFIDEAYGLMNDFGKEAIEVLIQFMVNNDDTVVIFAGYTDEMKRFINECNPGFRSHCFNEALGFFYFEDYELDVLKDTVIVDRIRNLNIDNRPIFTGLYGCLYGQEYFVENNLNLYSYWQELYRYLRGEGYTTVFYNEAYNFYSYEESQLETLFFKKPEEISKETGLDSNLQGRYVSQFSSPNGHNRRRGVRLSNENGTERLIPHENSSTDLVSHNPGILVKTIEHGKNIKGDQFFQLQSRERVMDRLFGFMDNNPGHKLAVVFTMPSEIFFGRLDPSYHSDFQGRFSQQEYAGSSLRCLVLYDFNVVTQLYESLQQGGAFFFHTWFKNQMFPDQQEGRFGLHKPSSALFHVGKMGKDEVGNMLKRRCAMEGLRYTMSPIPFDDLCSRICQQFIVEDPETGEKTSIESVAEFMELPIPVVERTILRMDEEKAINKLKRMRGIDKLIEQFEKYLKAYHQAQANKKGPRFRPHMAFMGNPGTGKTTVARLFAEILHEEGLLPKGHFVEAKPGDLIGQYIGSTRIKTQAVCDRAQGGVLFIDEAYGLMSGANENGNADFGQEAIEVLIQFMENNKDSLVIVAGYPDEIKRLINEGNPGFKSRFNEKLGFFYFEDYEPDVLYQIARKNIPDDIKTTEAFDKALRNIIVLKHAYRTKFFGNARDMENLASTIYNAYVDAEDNGPLDVKHLPEELRVLVDPSMLKEDVMLAELYNKIVGQENVKKIVSDLYMRCLAERQKMFDTEDHTPELQRLNYVFLGNPGTGKTTVARIIGNLLQKMGVLSSNDASVLTEVSGGDVAHMTPAQIQRLFEDNIGKVLFIDEAYMLSHNPQAICEIVKNVTDPNYQYKMCVILAGYTTEMHQMMRLNPGMVSRFNEVIFQDFTNQELWEILKRKINAPDSQFVMDEKACEQKALNYFASLPRGRDFGNARSIEDLLRSLRNNQDKRYAEATPEQRKDPDFAMRILPEDFPQDMSTSSMSDEEVLRELNSLVGLEKVKNAINDIITNARAQYQRSQTRNTNENRTGLNFVFRGNPGTGKTTVARLLGNILANYGLVAHPEVVTYTKGQLVDQYVGSGARNVEKMFEDSVGKVLFIDEAYQLADHDSNEVLDALTSMMTDVRFKDQLAIILAGYPGEMSGLLDSNPGLRSRFSYIIDFDDFSDDELTEIFRKKLASEGFVANKDALAHARAYFATIPRNSSFGNAREAEKLLEIIKINQGKRIIAITNPAQEELFTIVPGDFPNFGRINVDAYRPQQCPAPSPMDKLNRLIGIDQIREQFERYLKMFHYCRNNPQTSIGNAFRPHMVFMGNPGTGKTTVARLFATILKEKGLLSNDSFVEVSPTDLVGLYVGQTARQARMQFERAKGGVLFIDEAYALNRGMNDYHLEALEALFKFMEDERDTIVILAGYTNAMQDMLNDIPGLRSRFTNEFVFEDFKPNDLFEILMSKLGEHETSENFKSNMRKIIQIQFEHRDPTIWGNARTMENYATEILGNFIAKHNATGIIDTDCIPESIMVVKIKLNQ